MILGWKFGFEMVLGPNLGDLDFSDVDFQSF